MENICRICMAVNTDLMAIATQSDTEIKLLKMGTMFEDCFAIAVKEIPIHLEICMICKIQLNYFYDFKKQAHQTHEKLTKLAKVIKVESELEAVETEEPSAHDPQDDLYSEEQELFSQDQDDEMLQEYDEAFCDEAVPNDDDEREILIEYLEDEDIDLFTPQTTNTQSSNASLKNEEQLDADPNFLEESFKRNKHENAEQDSDQEDEEELEEEGESDEVYAYYVAKKYRTTKKEVRWKKYRCDSCDKNFRNLEIYTGHMNVHQGLPAYRCEICSKNFKFKVNFDYHMKNHNNNRDFKCSICDKSCISKWDLKVHMRTHADIRPYVCTVCGKGFRVRSHMTDHVETHNDQNTYECSICFQKYKTKVTLKMHVSTIHTKMQQFICGTCDKIFSRKHHLKIHQKVHVRNIKIE